MKLVAVKVMKTQLSFLFNNKLIRLCRMTTNVTKLSNFLMRIKSEGFKNENVGGGNKYNLHERNLLLDSFKIFGALIISLLHLQWKIVPGGYLFVEMFFLMTGFLLAKNEKKYQAQPILSIFRRRLSSFYFYYFVAFLFAVVLCQFPTGFDTINYFTFLSSLGLGRFYGFGSLWFLGIYLFFSIGYIYLRKKINYPFFVLFIIFLVTLFLYTLYSQIPWHGINMTYEKYLGPFPVAFYRGGIGIGLGYICFYLADKKKNFFNTNLSVLIGFFVFLLLLYILFRRTPGSEYDYISYAVFGYLVPFLFFSKHFLMRKLNLCLSLLPPVIFSLFLEIYIFHYAVINMASKISSDSKFFLENHVALYLILIVIFSLLMKKVRSIVMEKFIRCLPYYN